MLVSTVDAWCRAADFARFVEAALRRPREATVLAVTPLVADEKPLGAMLDGEGRITALGVESPALLTAGTLPPVGGGRGPHTAGRPGTAVARPAWPGGVRRAVLPGA